MSYMTTIQDTFDEKKKQQQQPQQPQKQQQMHPAAVPVNNYIQKWVDAKIPVTEGQTVPGQISFFLQLLINNPQIKNVLEIGFNAGLSSGAFLACRPDVKVVAVDVGVHDYILPAQKFIAETFPGRHMLLVGDSADVLPQLLTTFPDYKPDLIFIDGAHTEPVVSKDIANCLELCKPGCFILIDDYHLKYPYQPEVKAAVDAALKSQKIVLLQQAEADTREWGLFKKIF